MNQETSSIIENGFKNWEKSVDYKNGTHSELSITNTYSDSDIVTEHLEIFTNRNVMSVESNALSVFMDESEIYICLHEDHLIHRLNIETVKENGVMEQNYSPLELKDQFIKQFNCAKAK